MVIILMLNWMIGTERLNSWIELSISDHYRYVSARIVCFRHPVIPILLSRMSSSFPFSFIRKNTVTWLESFPNCSDRFHLTVGSAGSLKVGSTSALVFGCYRTLFFFQGSNTSLRCQACSSSAHWQPSRVFQIGMDILPVGTIWPDWWGYGYKILPLDTSMRTKFYPE